MRWQRGPDHDEVEMAGVIGKVDPLARVGGTFAVDRRSGEKLRDASDRAAHQLLHFDSRMRLMFAVRRAMVTTQPRMISTSAAVQRVGG